MLAAYQAHGLSSGSMPKLLQGVSTTRGSTSLRYWHDTSILEAKAEALPWLSMDLAKGRGFQLSIAKQSLVALAAPQVSHLVESAMGTAPMSIHETAAALQTL
jgi:hypothetical protein